MSIAERVAILSKSYRPVPIDMPLDIPHLDEDAINHLYTWLRTSYDWEGTMDRLFEQDVTPETLAYEIVDAWDCVAYPGLQGYTWAVEDSNEVNPIQEVDLGDGIWDERDGVMRSPEDPQQQIPTICVSPVVEDTPSSLGEPVRNKRTRRTHKDLPNLHLSPNETRKDFLRVPSSPTLLFSPPPAYASTTTDDLNIGMAPYEVWSGKKAGFVTHYTTFAWFFCLPLIT